MYHHNFRDEGFELMVCVDPHNRTEFQVQVYTFGYIMTMEVEPVDGESAQDSFARIIDSARRATRQVNFNLYETGKVIGCTHAIN
jgi:hypothetical protein